MKVFVTGATGFIGSAVVRELLANGHSVLGLARSDDAASALRKLGAEPHRGELGDVQSLASGAAAADGVIHTAFVHDFTRYVENADLDRRAVVAMADALESTNKPMVATSVTTLLQPGVLGTESDAPASGDALGPRTASENAALGAARRGVRASVVRLPPSVHGEGDRAFMPGLIGIARQKGFAAYVGSGSNRWPAVHRLDAARLLRLALEKAQPGVRLHATAEDGIEMRYIAEAIGTGLSLDHRSIEPAEALSYFDWLAHFATADNPISSAVTRETLGWEPVQAGLLEDIRTSGYF